MSWINKKNAANFLSLFVLTLLLSVAYVAHAQEHLAPDCKDGGPCSASDFIPFINKIVNTIMIIVVPLAVLGIGYGGALMIIGSQNPGKRTEGIDAIKYSLIGVAITFGGWLIIKVILVGLEVQSGVFNSPIPIN